MAEEDEPVLRSHDRVIELLKSTSRGSSLGASLGTRGSDGDRFVTGRVAGDRGWCSVRIRFVGGLAVAG
jgi:hypothetical protein